MEGGGGTLIFSYIRTLGCFGGSNFEFHYFFLGGGGSRKIKYFWGHKDFVDIFVGHHKIGLYLGVISMHFRVFSLSPYTEWMGFWGVGKISNIFLGCFKFLIFFGVNDRCWARAYV